MIANVLMCEIKFAQIISKKTFQTVAYTVANLNHKICYFFSTCTCAPHFEKGSPSHAHNPV